MARTKADIADDVARILALAGASQAASGADNALLLKSVENCHAELAHHDIAWWAIDECPNEAAEGFAQYVAGNVAERFVTEDRASYLKSQMPLALRRLVAVTSKRDLSDLPTKFDDF